MLRIHPSLLTVGLVFLFGCSSGDEEAVTKQAAEEVHNEVEQSWREERLSVGRKTYEKACASCHDTGKLDAPITGNPKHWTGRSSLWEAVLFEHAKTGYREMPGKGGNEELTDESVEAAAEYMLSLTHPELPLD